ncbi:MAG: Gfo/Idh/MocA family oxidoreductase [Erysipelothrix sp.]|nr:Gfo/Idh/MocA family oxidoreductase [Erysipelothrix sp.]
MEMIHAAVVGVGFIGKQHIEAIHRIPNTKVVAVVETDFIRAQETAADYGIPHAFDNISDLLKLDGLDVVHICTPNHLHYPMAKEVIMAKKNVFCEKPLALNTSQTQELVELVDTYKVKSAVNHNYRSNVMVREMRARILRGDIGKPLLGQGQYIQDWLMFDTDYDWHFDPEKVGPSRSVADIGSHLFDLVQFVYNEKIVSVFAKLITVYPTRKQREQFGETFSLEYGEEVTEVPVENEDAAFIIAKLESGIHVSMDVSQVTGGHKNDLRLVVSGSKASLTWCQERADILQVGKRDEGNEIVYADSKYVDPSVRRLISLPNGHAVGWADGLKNSILDFYSDLRGDVEKDQIGYPTIADGHNLMKLVEACLESNENNRWVDIKE